MVRDRGAVPWARVLVIGVLCFACGESKRRLDPGEERGGVVGMLTVRDALGLPLAHVPALVDGEVVRTDQDGLAAIHELPPVYDVALAYGYVFGFNGLTARAPVIQLRGQIGANSYETSVIVRRPVLLADEIMFVTAGTQSVTLERPLTTGELDMGTSVTFVVTGSGPITFSLEAYLAKIDPVSRAVKSYSGYASEEFVFQGSSPPDWTPSFGPVPFDTANIHLDLDLPAGASIDSVRPAIREEAGLMGYLGSPVVGNVSDFVVPDVPGATFDFAIAAHDAAGSFSRYVTGVRAGASELVALEAGAALTAPDEGAAVSLDTEFSWTAPDGSLSLLDLHSSEDSSFSWYFVATSTLPVRCPDVAALGFSFPVGEALNWHGEWMQGPDSFDAYAAGAPIDAWGSTVHRSAVGAP